MKYTLSERGATAGCKYFREYHWEDDEEMVEVKVRIEEFGQPRNIDF